MRPPFRSVSFPSLRQWGALLPPKKAKRLQRDCTSLRPSCWPLHLVGKCSLAPLVRFSVSLRKKAVFSRKKSVRSERTFFPKMAYLVFVPPPLHKNMICKKVLYITRSYGAFFIPQPLAAGNAP